MIDKIAECSVREKEKPIFYGWSSESPQHQKLYCKECYEFSYSKVKCKHCGEEETREYYSKHLSDRHNE